MSDKDIYKIMTSIIYAGYCANPEVTSDTQTVIDVTISDANKLWRTIESAQNDLVEK